MGGKKGGERLALFLAPFSVFSLNCGDQNSPVSLDYPQVPNTSEKDAQE